MSLFIFVVLEDGARESAPTARQLQLPSSNRKVTENTSESLCNSSSTCNRDLLFRTNEQALAGRLPAVPHSRGGRGLCSTTPGGNSLAAATVNSSEAVFATTVDRYRFNGMAAFAVL